MSWNLINVEVPTSSGESVSSNYLLSLSKELGHKVYPINYIRERTFKNENSYTAEELQLSNLKSSLYLRSDKFMTIMIPNPDGYHWSINGITILNKNNRDLISLAPVHYSYTVLYDSDKDEYYHCIALYVFQIKEIEPQEISIGIVHDEEE